MASVRIHGYPISTWTRTARMTCVEKEIAYELVPVAYRTEAHGELHPFRRMPIVEANGLVLIESLAITGYLDEAFPGPSLQPDDIDGRARMRTWMGICADYLFRDVVRGLPRGENPTDEQSQAARTALERAESVGVGGPFLVGEALTLADLWLAPQIANCQEKAPEIVEGLERIGAWWSMMQGRESVAETAS
ncbi:MAG TPA: glutathione S-transferase family protein [Solirubrobacteraceae bacterium]|nr:glutathione S-transferase family protein [Solirubrobacteraceae bacterium]